VDKSKEFSLMLDNAIKQHPKDFVGFDRTKNVQDQLQEMVRVFNLKLQEMVRVFNLKDYLRIVCESETYRKDEYLFQFKTMEQLWLAFVMKERFGKTWNGEDWII